MLEPIMDRLEETCLAAEGGGLRTVSPCTRFWVLEAADCDVLIFVWVRCLETFSTLLAKITEMERT